MSFTEHIASVVADLNADGAIASNAVATGLSLAVAAWPMGAAADPATMWDLFGLEVCAAAEILHIGVPPARPELGLVVDSRQLRLEMVRLVEALAAYLEAATDGAGYPIDQQLELHAAAVQLKRAGGAVR